jgi:hypothetical protein
MTLPATPDAVEALTVQEFTFDLEQLDGIRVPSLERVCVTFRGDANRVLTWWIRFGAFKNWCAGSDATTRSSFGSWIVRDACEVAASFPLNHLWEFDPTDFGFAVAAMAVRRAETGADR